jgi:hypothetical protein
MKIPHMKHIIFFLIFSASLYGQKLEIVDTKDLLEISDEFGLDSALKSTNGIPIYFLDSNTTARLAEHSLDNEPTEEIESFIVDYALHVNNPNNGKILVDLFSKKLDRIIDYQPDNHGYLPKITNDILISLIIHPNDKTENLLINYYDSWTDKAVIYKDDYYKGIASSDIREKEKLMTPYQICNLNCYKLMLALDSINSDYYNSIKLLAHNEILKEHSKNMFLYRNGDYDDFSDTTTYDILHLDGNYKSLGEIDFYKESSTKDLIKGYKKSYCWKFMIFNNRIGYLDLGCQSAPLAGSGELYRLELIDGDKLKLTMIYGWIS